MTRIRIVVSVLLLSALSMAGQSYGGVDWGIYKTVPLEAAPIDVAVSNNGRWIFVLTDRGEIHIFEDGRFTDKIKVGTQIDQIKVGPREELLLLISKKNKTMQVVSLDFVRDIRVTGDPFKGPENAPVTVVGFSDFQCEYCKEMAAVLEQAHVMYPDDVKVVFKNFPIKKHPLAAKAGAAALAAHQQGKFWEFHDMLFQNQEQLSEPKILEIAEGLGLDMKAFKKEMDNPKTMRRVRQDQQDGVKAGVKSVPSVFVNGKLLKLRSMEGLVASIEKELKQK